MLTRWHRTEFPKLALAGFVASQTKWPDRQGGLLTGDGGFTGAMRPSLSQSTPTQSSGNFPQPLLERLARVLVACQTLAVLENDDTFSLIQGLELPDAIQIDDRGSVNPEESGRVQHLLHFVHAGPEQMRLLANVQVDIVAHRLNPIDLLRAYEQDSTAGLDWQSAIKLRPSEEGIDQMAQPLVKHGRFTPLEKGFRPQQGLLKPLLVERFQEVIQ